MPRLRDLEARFLKLADDAGNLWQEVATLEEAQGVKFLCPLCFEKNAGPVGTHHVVCWSRSRGVPDHVRPKPGRWKLVGTSLDDLTLNADPPAKARSVQITGGCGWHGHVTNGAAQ